MPVIKKLSDQLINQIAAGEVVERPASVIKELVENSIDAGAKRMTIEIMGSGRSFMRITDNGGGMDPDDAVLAFERHATSKIGTNEDLLKIRSLGFRGEAIASIASVSKMKLVTKKTGALSGTYVSSEGGKILENKPAGTPEGTSIEITDLFFNTPARSKFLKSESTEYQHILDTVTGLALAYPETAFRLIHNDKQVFDLPATTERLVRIQALLGKNIGADLVPVFYGHSALGIEGFIGKPEIARANKGNQRFIVNGRDIKSASLSFAVKQAFYSLMSKEKYPFFVLYLNIDPEAIDVNVHPRKTEIRFRDEKEVFRAVMQSCEKALNKHVLAPQVTTADFRQHQNLGMSFAEANVLEKVAQPVFISTGDAAITTSASMENTDMVDQNAVSGVLPRDTARARTDEDEMTALAQLSNSYILCQKGRALVIVDQHAAHERIRYTEILEQFEKRNKSIQPLLMPVQMELAHREVEILSANSDLLIEMGFEIEHFGGNTFVVLSVPSYIVKEDLQKVISGLIDDLSDDAKKGDYQRRKEKALTYMACRSAVKFGDKLSVEEQKNLIKKLQTLAQPYTCPHGRPTMINMSYSELAKRFGRA